MDKSLAGSDIALLVVYVRIKKKYTVLHKTLLLTTVEYSGRNGAGRDTSPICWGHFKKKIRWISHEQAQI